MRTRDGRARLAVWIGLALALLVAWLSAPAPLALFVDASAVDANSFTSGIWRLYLKTDGRGDRRSTPVLPLSTTTPTVATLPNYDTNRDAFAGLVIQKGGVGAGEADPLKHQTWSLTASSAITLSGTSQLTLWSAIREFNPTRRGVVDAFLLDCDSSGSSCTTIDSTTLDEASWARGSTTWVSKTLDFGSVDYTVAAARLLRVKIVVGAAADDAMWFAYDTTDYPSRLTIG
jgi:hypothetical protein